MRSVLLSCNSIVKEPPPVVALKGLDATALDIELLFRVSSPAQRTPARNEVLDLVYQHCKSAGLLLAMPAGICRRHAGLADRGNRGTAARDAARAHRSIPIFTALTDDEKRVLAEATWVRDFRIGEVIVRQGELLSALMMVRAGVIVMRHEEEEFGRLVPGDFFGDTGLLAGIGEAYTLEAFTRVTVCEIDRQAFAPLLMNRPATAEDLALSLSRRVRQVEAGAAPGPQQERSVRAFLKAIQTIFHR